MNGIREKEESPKEFQYEFDQEILKHIHHLKTEIRENGWIQKNSPEVLQTSFLQYENMVAELNFKFM